MFAEKEGRRGGLSPRLCGWGQVTDVTDPVIFCRATCKASMCPARPASGDKGSNLQAQANVLLDHMDLGDDEKGPLSCRAGFPAACGRVVFLCRTVIFITQVSLSC